MQDVSPKEFQNEDLKVLVSNIPPCQVELDIDVFPPLLLKARQEAIKNIKKEVSLPGFRKGKAPDALVIEKYKQNIDQEQKHAIADLAFAAAQKLVHISPFNSETKINYSVKEYSENNAKLHYRFEVGPTVPSVHPSNFSLKAIDLPTLGEKEVDEAIRQARFYFADWKEILDRPVQEGDYILLDLESLEKDPPEKVFSGVRFEVTEKGMSKWMRELVIGKNLLEPFEGISKPDDDASEKEKKEFSERKVRVTILKIEEATLPEIDEAFAAQMGAKTIEEMRANVKKILENQLREKEEKEKYRQVSDFLVNEHPFDLPPSLLTAEVRFRKQNLLHDPAFKKDFDKASEADKKHFEENLLTQSKHAISLFFLAKKVIDDQKISITNDEIKEEAAHIMYSEGKTFKSEKDIPQDFISHAYSRLVLHKAQKFILDQADKKA